MRSLGAFKIWINMVRHFTINGRHLRLSNTRLIRLSVWRSWQRMAPPRTLSNGSPGTGTLRSRGRPRPAPAEALCGGLALGHSVASRGVCSRSSRGGGAKDLKVNSVPAAGLGCGAGAGLARAAASGRVAGLGSDFRRRGLCGLLRRAQLAVLWPLLLGFLSSAALAGFGPASVNRSPRHRLPPSHSEAHQPRSP